jgi:putative DNA primase/helicase
MRKVMKTKGVDPVQHALILRDLKASTGLSAKELNLPPPVDPVARAEREERWKALEAGAGGLVDAKNPMDTARRFLRAGADAEGLPRLARWQGEYWEAQGTHYAPLSDEALSARLYAFLEGKRDVNDDKPIKPSRPDIEKLDHALKAAALIERDAPSWIGESPGLPDPADVVPFRNGLLDIRMRRLLAPTRRFFGLNARDFDFLDNAPAATQWLSFLDDIFGDDRESIETLQEVFGLMLTGDTSFQKIFMLVGPKRSGKGTIARILTKLVGQANTCAPTINGLGTQLGSETLIGKLVAIISDARLGTKTDASAVTETLLRISGEDGVSIQRKHRTDWTAKLPTRFLILSNEIPALLDQ